MNKEKLKKTGDIILNTVLYLFLAICVLSVFLTVFSKKDSDGAAEIFGYQMRVVASDSMAACELTDVSAYKIKSIPARSMVFVRVMPEDPMQADEWYRSLQVGDVLTFRYVYTKQVTITHRIVAITEKETGGFIIELEGDNVNAKDGQLSQIIDTSVPNNTNYVIGKVTGQNYLLGFIMSFLMQPISIILLIILPCLLIIGGEVIKIVKVLNADKKAKQQEEMLARERELEELRNRLAMLEKERNIGTTQNGKDEDS